MRLKNQSILNIIIFLILSCCSILASAQTPARKGQEVDDNANKQMETTWAKKKAVKWYKSHEWLNGLQLKPDNSIDQQEFSKQYHSNKVWWDKAFAFIKEKNLADLKPGRYPISEDNVYAIVSEGTTRDYDSTMWEAHRDYADIHYVIKGKEKIGIATVSSARITKDYDSTKDIGFYTTHGQFFIADPSTFFIVFPKNTHFPGINVDGPHVVKKLVIKIRTVK